MYVDSKAIVLSSLKYKDADLIVKCYTEAQGLVSFMVKGVLKSKKGKLKPAMFQSFNILNIGFNYKNKGQLEFFKDVRVEAHLNSISKDVYKSSMAMFLAEILKSVIYEEEPNPRLFKFIEDSILRLEYSKQFANMHISFLIKLSSFLGFSPHLPIKKEDIYFNLDEGFFQDHENKYTLNQENSNALLSFIKAPIAESHQIQLNKTQRNNLLKVMITYYRLHIESFKTPKSLEVIESIFS